MKANVRIWCWHEGMLVRHHQIAILTKFECSKSDLDDEIHCPKFT
jgi:hypothetical protein